MRTLALVSVICLAAAGCGSGAAKRMPPSADVRLDGRGGAAPRQSERVPRDHLRPASFEESAADGQPIPDQQSTADRLDDLIAEALAANPKLGQMREDAAAAWAKMRYADKLPDPMAGAAGLTPPMQFADGQQVAMVSFSQRLPWLAKLDAVARRAALEASALDYAYRAEQLRVVADVKAAWYELYVVDRQMAINQANQAIIELLIDVANDKVVAQSATEGDVLRGTLELSRLTEASYELSQRRSALAAGLNRLRNRRADDEIASPPALDMPPADWDLPALVELAWEFQPEIAAARLRVRAGSWGIRVAELERRPELVLGADWFVMDPTDMGGAGRTGGEDSWQLGAMLSLPVWRAKYDAMRNEAVRMRRSARHTVEELRLQFEEALAQRVAQAKAAEKISVLYRDTMIPQARRAFDADQASYAGPGTVEFDRVIEDFRSVLELEERYHEALADWAAAVAQIEQAVGVGLADAQVAVQSEPAQDAPSEDGA